MELKMEMFFIGCRSFKSKDGKTFNIVSLAEQNKANPLGGSSIDAFVDTLPDVLKECSFLDKVECLLSLEDMKSKPRLVTVTRRVATPIFNEV